MFSKKSKQMDDRKSSYGAEKIQDMMKKLNINIEKIAAKEVVIKTEDRNIVIASPDVMKTVIMGRDVYQVTGQTNELPAINEEDIKLVMKKTGKDRIVVVKKLEELNNDLVKAIIELKKKSK